MSKKQNSKRMAINLKIAAEVEKRIKLPQANELIKPEVWLEFRRKYVNEYRRIENERATIIL